MFKIGDKVVIWNKEAAAKFCLPSRILDKVLTVQWAGSGRDIVDATEPGCRIIWHIPAKCLRHRGEIIFEETMS